MTDSNPYRVGGHSPINIWCDPQRGDKTGQQIAMAMSPQWAETIVAALNAPLLEGHHLSGPYRVDGDINIRRDPEPGRLAGEQIATATSPQWARDIVDALNAGCEVSDRDRREIATEIRDDRTRDAGGLE